MKFPWIYRITVFLSYNFFILTFKFSSRKGNMAESKSWRFGGTRTRLRQNRQRVRQVDVPTGGSELLCCLSLSSCWQYEKPFVGYLGVLHFIHCCPGFKRSAGVSRLVNNRLQEGRGLLSCCGLPVGPPARWFQYSYSKLVWLHNLGY